MSENIFIDGSYNIREIEVDSSWEKDLKTPEYIEYRRKWDLASNNHHLFEFPLFIEIESSYTCNYLCPQCPRQALNHGKVGGIMSDELFNILLDEARKYNLPSMSYGHGCEPLMRKDIGELIRKSREAGIIYRKFSTNGYLLTRKLSKELIESGLTVINFSLDAASESTYSKLRIGGDFNKVVDNINVFLDEKKKSGKSYPRVRVSFIVSEENKNEQQVFYDMWRKKVNVISFQKCYDFNFSLTKNNRENKYNQKRDHYCCSQLWQLLCITVDGDIIICNHDYNHRHVLGNLKTHSIYECWHSDTMNRFREFHLNNKWNKLPLCEGCVSSIKDILVV